MTIEHDEGFARRFCIAAGVLLSDSDACNLDEPVVKFTCGPALSPELRRSVASHALDSGVSIVHLEGPAGNDVEEPMNVVVFHHQDGALETWTECSFWVPLRGPGLIVPRHGDESIGYTGRDLYLDFGVADESRGPGFERARVRLAELAMQVDCTDLRSAFEFKQ